MEYEREKKFLLALKAVHDGNESKALLGLALLYNVGTDSIEKNPVKALYYFEKAGELGQRDGAYNAAITHDENGNSHLAHIWYEKAANLGESKAMYNLGLIYAEGQGVAQNYNKAIDWYKKSSLLGNIKAIYNMGVMEQNGQGLDRSYAGALEKYKISGLGGHDLAAYNAGALYEQVFNDASNAFIWYEKAANLGLAEGMFEIGKMYHQGVGVVANNEAAELWLIKAYELGNSSAKNYLIQNSG